MSIGSMAGLGGNLSLDTSTDCLCHQINPVTYPPEPCCPNSGNGCSGDGGNTGFGSGPLGIGPPGGGNGGGNGGSCCSNNGNGPFLAPSGGSGSGSCCGNGTNGGGNAPPGNGYIRCLEGTYGGGRDSVPTPLGNIRNGAVLLPLGSGGPISQPPCVSPTGTAPAAVPSSSAPFSQTVSVVHGVPIGQNPAVSGLWVTCVDTGVTLTSSCTNMVFYQNGGGTKTYTTPGGPSLACNTGLAYSAHSAQGSGTVPNAVTFNV
jgi:hypothetical protein